jgi:hypothetical protein
MNLKREEESLKDKMSLWCAFLKVKVTSVFSLETEFENLAQEIKKYNIFIAFYVI